VSPTVGTPGVGPGQLWDAPVATGPVDSTIAIPGSKSLTARYLILSALADGPVTITGGLHSRDANLMIDALRTLTVDIEDSEPEWVVTPSHLRGNQFIECGLAGTVMRFVPPMVLLADGPVSFDGDSGARDRPMAPLIGALRDLGAKVDDAGLDSLPFVVTPSDDIGSEVSVDASTSSQFITGLLLVAARFPQGLTVRHMGDALPSLPHIDMTIANLKEAGVRIDQPDDHTWIVHPGPIHLESVTVEPDLSNAGPFMAAALAAGGTVRIPGWPEATTQPGALLPDILTRMGATCHVEDGAMTVTSMGTIYPIEADLSAFGEMTPTVAALCALADGPSTLTGIGHLRGHETDRLAAIAQEIQRLGGNCEDRPDRLVITPPASGRLVGADVHTYHDHRMATFGAIIGLRVPGTRIINVGTTAKTVPDFPRMWRTMLGLDPEPA
jgi:3-phosphoshikimate 1-carboxyvinyltransferase